MLKLIFKLLGSFFQTDVYAFGCILYLLRSGFPPYLGESEYLIFQQKIEGELKFYSFFEEDIKELIGEMLQKNWEDRPSLEQVRESRYIKNALEEFGGIENLKAAFDSNFESLKTEEEKLKEKIKNSILGKFGSEESTSSSREEISEFIDQQISQSLPSEEENSFNKANFLQELNHLKRQILHFYRMEKFEHYY